jgi:N-methylhydantoinase A
MSEPSTVGSAPRAGTAAPAEPARNAGAAVRVGVDVGGTFTKAVAVLATTGEIVARSVRPTTHDSPSGVAEGVVACVADIAAAVGREQVVLVTHSTTQAVNALLEGDVGVVGVFGMGRIPELKRAEQRTSLKDVELAPGRFLRTKSVFLDVTGGLTDETATKALRTLIDAGADSVCIAEAFSPDDPSKEERVAVLAGNLGLPACASTELSGLYGLELRAVTAAINASILPIALRTAEFVGAGVRESGIDAPVMVMRGDGGATDLAGFRRAPARTLYSGPAASVAGALRTADVVDAVVVEVGGTSTNVAAVRNGRPALSYVQVASHSTAVRAVDVRVVGVAGGSILRLRKLRFRSGRRSWEVAGLGPRSAHIAGLPYACFLSPDDFDGATAALEAPTPGDYADHVVLSLADGRRVTLTTTCAANALGVALPGDYCYSPPAAALAAFAVIEKQFGIAGAVVAERMLVAAGEEVAEMISVLVHAQKLSQPEIVAVGGGAGGLGRYVASMLGFNVRVPEGAEIISSIGDALSLIRVEKERTVDATNPDLIRQLLAEVEEEALASGASRASLDLRIEELPEQGTVRAIATGAVAMRAGAVPGRPLADAETVRGTVGASADVRHVGSYWIATGVAHGAAVMVLDRFGDPVQEIEGQVVALPDVSCSADAVGDLAAAVRAVIERNTRHRGPITLHPMAWVVDGSAIVEVGSGDVAAGAAALVVRPTGDAGEPVRAAAIVAAVIVGRAR